MALNLLRLRDVYNISIDQMISGQLGIGAEPIKALTLDNCFFIRNLVTAYIALVLEKYLG